MSCVESHTAYCGTRDGLYFALVGQRVDRMESKENLKH